MAKHIDKKTVIAYPEDVKAVCPSNACGTLAGIIEEIKNREYPAADVEPVRHGHWIWKRRTIGGTRRYTGVDDMGEVRTVTVDERRETVVNYCSECGKRGDDTFLRYCPNCGAKMSGKDGDKNA